MSIRYFSAVMEAKIGGGTRKLVLLKLADCANDDGVCWPTYETISKHCETERRNVMRYIKSLKEDGLVKVEHRMGPNGNRSNYYILNYQAIKSRGGNIDTRGVVNSTLGWWRDCHPEPSLEPSLESKDKTLVSKADACDESLLKTWNDFAEENGLAKLRGITDQKKKIAMQCFTHYKKVKQQIGQTVQITTLAEFAEAYLAAVNGLMTDFHRGASGWKASYDFIFAKQVMENVITTNELRRK